MKKGLRIVLSVLFLILALGFIGFGICFGRFTYQKLTQLQQNGMLDQLILSVIAAAFGCCVLICLVFFWLHKSSGLENQTLLLKKKNEMLESLNQQAQKLAHHQRLEIMGTLTSSIAHEFNNLLTPIMGYSLMALEKLPPEEDGIYDDILEIYNSSRKAKEVISRLSDLTRKNSIEVFRDVSPDELIQKTLHVATPAKPKNTEIRLDLNCWDQRIRANEIQISQLLLNLILNGFHAIGEEAGVLTIHTSFDEAYIHIRVTDTGCGISEETLPKIFEPFFTTKEPEKGTGLGLAIVAQVVEDHNGKVSVESKLNRGTTVMVSLSREKELSE